VIHTASLVDHAGGMASWIDVTRNAPELGVAVQQRFDAHGVGLLATIRRDGSPRIAGLEPLFALDELWLGMMPGSRKSADVRRDSRFALHSTIADKNVVDGDARISGRAAWVEDDGVKAAFAEAFAAATGYPPGVGPFDLFRADVSEIMFLKPEGDHLTIRWWNERDGLHTVERR
jgi:hypothetical protein